MKDRFRYMPELNPENIRERIRQNSDSLDDMTLNVLDLYLGSDKGYGLFNFYNVSVELGIPVREARRRVLRVLKKLAG